MLVVMDIDYCVLGMHSSRGYECIFAIKVLYLNLSFKNGWEQLTYDCFVRGFCACTYINIFTVLYARHPKKI